MFENEKLTVMYGSQTGNAKDLAEKIGRESKLFYFKSVIKSLDKYNIAELVNEPFIIFVCSTTGQGEEPQSMKSFWKFLLRKNLPLTYLNNLKYAVFGLGDSSYVKFNFAAKRLFKRLQQLGADPLIPLGLGDDQHDLGYEAAADSWMEDLWKNLLVFCPLPYGMQPLPKSICLKPRWKVTTFLPENNDYKLQSMYYSVRKCTDFSSTVIENKRLTSLEHFQDVRLLKFQTNGQKYSPGDVVVLRPQNLPWKIEEFKKVLASNGINIPSDEVFVLSKNDFKISVPEVLKQNVTFKQLYTEYFDLMALPTRHTFEILANLTDSNLEKEKCLEFASIEGQDGFLSYAYRPRRNLVEILIDFPHATRNLNKEILFEIFPPIRPREFSVASSWKANPDEIHILLAVVRYKSKLVKERFGLASNYLAKLQNGDQITMWLKNGSFKFPVDRETPVIMVGPGTGVAPFRNYLFERFTEQSANPENLILFFGCRYKNKDFLCKEDFEYLQQKDAFTLISAFSREGSDKVYVQHRILEHKKLVWKVLSKNGFIFVAGNAKNMPQGVRNAFIRVCTEAGNQTKEKAVKFIENLEKIGRYQCEVW